MKSFIWFRKLKVSSKGEGWSQNGERNSKDELEQFFIKINSIHVNIQFTKELEQHNQLPYLDVLVTKSVDKFETSFPSLWRTLISRISDKSDHDQGKKKEINSNALGMFISRLLFAFINTKIINLLFFTCYEGKLSKTK